MSEPSDRKPYDTFFRQAFGEPEPARELALNLVPRQYEPLLSRGRITVDKDSLVDEELRTHYTDLLIRVEEPADAGPTKNAGAAQDAAPARNAVAARSLLVYVLVEHKSYPDRWVTLQMLRYLIVIWQREKSRAQGRGKLPLVLPAILYHGTRKWRDPEFTRLVEGATPADWYVPRFRPFFMNLAELPPERVRGSVRTVAALMVLKHVKQQFSEARVRELLAALEQARKDPRWQEFAALCFRLLLLVKEREEIEYLQTLARKPEYHGVQETVMTYGEELLQEGLEKGIDQGELGDKRAVLTRLLDRKFGLSDADRARIAACEDRDALDAALDEIVAATSKSAVLSRLP